MNYIPRSMEPLLRQLLDKDVAETGCLLVEGARQVGKTTLATAVLDQIKAPVYRLDLEENHRFRLRIDACEDFKDFSDLLGDQLGFKPSDGGILFIDEAQESRNLGRFVRYMKERWPGARVLLTGSSLNRLFRGDVRYPVGRVTRIHVAPFNFPEYLRAIGHADLAEVLDHHDLSLITPSRHQLLLDHYDHFLSIGGMPEVVLAHAAGKDYRARRSDLLADLQQDFLRLFGEDDLATVVLCLRSVANFVGSPSKISTVLNDGGRKARRTAESVFARLEQWSVILSSQQMGPSPESSHRFHPKRYLFDTGLLRHLRESAVPGIGVVDTVDAVQRKPLGGILENQVAIALHHQLGSLQGWKRSSSGAEIDFIAHGEGRQYPVECKAALEIKRTHLKGLRAYLDHYDLPVGFLVSFDRYREFLLDNRRLINIPAYGVQNWLKGLETLTIPVKTRTR